ncbi:MAG: prepilin-type N-terminal cleavage/methylation domain-containing protein, partial [Deltaproteobacteria bacterium]|nr:prepilin-type N-terminal cleavage/methylation domain-containing protein [Deltaproteobacteria bacterium]
MIHHNYDNQRPEVTPRLRSGDGFTLIEVLIAMVILSIGLLGTAALITGIIRGNQVSNRITTATVLAQDKMEEIKNMQYLNVVAESLSIITDYPLYKREVAVDPLGTGTQTVT